jgi:hypothetical protein
MCRTTKFLPKALNKGFFHCDSAGKLLEEFKWEPNSQSLSIIGHKYKESLVKHEFFSRRGAASPAKKMFVPMVLN